MNCIFCGGIVVKCWSLGEMPPSDSFCKSKNNALDFKCHELAIGYCNDCKLVQNIDLIPENQRYIDLDYAYSSANSEYAMRHWQEFVNYISGLVENIQSPKILEVGSNDGYCLGLVKNFIPGSDCHGADASPYQVANAKSRYRDCHFADVVFGNDDDHYQDCFFDLIYANNVVNHSNNLASFIRRVMSLLRPEGLFVFEVPLLDMTFINKKWDQIYHEHTAYFTLNSIHNVIHSSGMRVNSIVLNDYHGGSVRVTAQLASQKNVNITYREDPRLIEDSIDGLRLSAQQIKHKLLDKIKKIKSEGGKKIYLFGAPAKGVTLINYCNLNTGDIEACLENSESKIGKFIPKSGIPIIEESCVIPGSYAINLIWNNPVLFKNFCLKHKLMEVNFEDR